MTDRRILKSVHGVTLESRQLRHGAVVVSEQFVVTSKRTPEDKNFGQQQDAEAYFAEEVKRCSIS